MNSIPFNQAHYLKDSCSLAHLLINIHACAPLNAAVIQGQRSAHSSARCKVVELCTRPQVSRLQRCRVIHRSHGCKCIAIHTYSPIALYKVVKVYSHPHVTRLQRFADINTSQSCKCVQSSTRHQAVKVYSNPQVTRLQRLKSFTRHEVVEVYRHHITRLQRQSSMHHKTVEAYSHQRVTKL